MGKDQAEDLEKIYNWTQLTIKLLSDLEHDFSELLQEWKTFCSRCGDIGYFSNISSDMAPGHCYKSLRSIKETFEELEYVRQRLEHLKNSSRQWAENVSFAILLTNKPFH